MQKILVTKSLNEQKMIAIEQRTCLITDSLARDRCKESRFPLSRLRVHGHSGLEILCVLDPASGGDLYASQLLHARETTFIPEASWIENSPVASFMSTSTLLTHNISERGSRVG